MFQTSQDNSVDFYRGWQEYKNGFSDLNRNYWLGLEKIHRLTEANQTVLRVDLMDFDNAVAYAQYSTFSVTSGSDDYRLNAGDFSGKYLLKVVFFSRDQYR